MRNLENKSVIVTGGGNGIGKTASLLFAAHGAKVTVADIVADAGEQVVADIKAAGGDAQFVRTDISDAGDAQSMVRRVIETFGTLDGAFNNAGIPNIGKSLHQLTLEEWQRHQAINLTGTFLCMKYEIEAMLKPGRGAIVNTVSAAGLVGIALTTEYCVSKHGVVGLTKSAAVDYGRSGIRVNGIAPGVVRTAMFEEACRNTPGLEVRCAESHPIGRYSEPLEQAEAAMWLLSDAASFVTGVILPVDGGWTAV